MKEKYNEHVKSHEKYLKNVDDFLRDTIKLLKSEKICPKSARWLGAKEIVYIAQRIHTETHYANNIRVENAKEKQDRKAAQERAVALMKTLGEKFEFCSGIWDIDTDRLEAWLDKKGEIQSWISGWQRKEESRFEDIG